MAFTKKNIFLTIYPGRPISVDWAVPKDKYMQHVVNKQLEMQDDVKKEESDSDDELMDTSAEVKQEVKSEFSFCST